MSIQIGHFLISDTHLYHQYLQLKHQIFTVEYGWGLTSTVDSNNREVALSDDYDADATFVSAVVNNQLIGVARLCDSNSKRPYADLYAEYLETGAISETYVVVNAVAVDANYRHVELVSSLYDQAKQVTISARLMEESERIAKSLGSQQIVLTAGYGRSQRFFTKMGFQPMADSYEKEWAPVRLIDLQKRI